MKIHTIIIDDELSGVRSLELMLQKFVPEVKVVATTSDALNGVELINNYRPDLVFLDINMPVLNGFDLLERLQFTNFHLIFSTAYTEYALRALKRNACDYLLKPVNLDELKSAIGRVKLKMEENSIVSGTIKVVENFTKMKNLRIPLTLREGIEYISPADIMYIEAYSNYSNVKLLSGEIKTVKQSLKEYETLLCNEWLYFMRVHNSFIVNLNSIKRYLRDSGNAVMHDESLIPVSKSKKEEFFSSINMKA